MFDGKLFAKRNLPWDFRGLHHRNMSSIEPQITFPTQSTVKCKGCDSEFDIKWFCRNCSASLCDDCREEHRNNKFLSKHSVVPRTDNLIRALDSSKISEPCSEHPEYAITGYCRDCDVPCCILCFNKIINVM